MNSKATFPALTLLLTCHLCQGQFLTTDQNRIEDVHTIAGLVEEYKEVTGRYPYSESWDNVKPGYSAVSVYIVITDQPVNDDIRYPSGMSCRTYPKTMFEQYLSKGLGRKVTLPSDSIPIETYRFYQFVFDGRDYFVSCVLDEPTAFTRQLRNDRHKYQVSSTANPARKIYNYKDLVKQQKDSHDKPAVNPGN